MELQYLLIGMNAATLLTMISGLIKIGAWVGRIETRIANVEKDIGNLPCIKKPDEYFKDKK